MSLYHRNTLYQIILYDMIVGRRVSPCPRPPSVRAGPDRPASDAVTPSLPAKIIPTKIR